MNPKTYLECLLFNELKEAGNIQAALFKKGNDGHMTTWPEGMDHAKDLHNMIIEVERLQESAAILDKISDGVTAVKGMFNNLFNSEEKK